jgi:hypothetical protein
VKNRSCETLEMGAGKPSVSCTFNTNRHCGGYIARGRTSVRITRSLLGCNRHPCRNAINARCDTSNFRRTHCRNRAGRPSRSAPGDLVSRKSHRLRDRGICAGTFVHRIPHGENCVSLREHHAWNHRAHSAFKRRMDRCASSLLRSLGGNPRRPGTRRHLARTSDRIRKKKRRVGSLWWSACRSRSTDFAADTAASTGFRSITSRRDLFQPMRTTRGSSRPREANSGNSAGCKIPARISALSTIRGPGRAK